MRPAHRGVGDVGGGGGGGISDIGAAAPALVERRWLDGYGSPPGH